MVSRLLFLEPGQLRRAWMFFVFYVVLFAALTLADGLSLALFVARLGAAELPRYQALSAVCVMLSVGWYLHAAGGRDRRRTFAMILLAPLVMFVGVWGGLLLQMRPEPVLGLLFLARELAFALVLLHFGEYLQDYFTRAELNRVMPVIYAGGRVGGMAAGAALEHASVAVAPVHLLLLLAALLAVCILGIHAIARWGYPLQATGAIETQTSAPVAQPPSEAFLPLLWKSRLLFWISASTIALFVCRTGLSLECNRCFQREFSGDAELARFLGRYAQIALAVSLPFQLFVVGRLVASIGLRGAQLTYAMLIAAAALCGWGEMSLAAAIFARFVETELRYGMRNPVAQMTVNLFPQHVRTQARAWSLGILIPAATLAAALGLDVLVRDGAWTTVAWVTALAAGGYLVASFGLAGAIDEPQHERSTASGGVALEHARVRITAA
jgi:hypothetical protein